MKQCLFVAVVLVFKIFKKSFLQLDALKELVAAIRITMSFNTNA